MSTLNRSENCEKFVPANRRPYNWKLYSFIKASGGKLQWTSLVRSATYNFLEFSDMNYPMLCYKGLNQFGSVSLPFSVGSTPSMCMQYISKLSREKTQDTKSPLIGIHSSFFWKLRQTKLLYSVVYWFSLITQQGVFMY